VGPAEVTSREVVVRAIREYDVLGRDVFLAKYGFKRSTKFVVVDNGREYDSKALAGCRVWLPVPGEGATVQYLQRW
jgi:hypothetical protein